MINNRDHRFRSQMRGGSSTGNSPNEKLQPNPSQNNTTKFINTTILHNWSVSPSIFQPPRHQSAGVKKSTLRKTRTSDNIIPKHPQSAFSTSASQVEFKNKALIMQLKSTIASLKDQIQTLKSRNKKKLENVQKQKEKAEKEKEIYV